MTTRSSTSHAGATAALMTSSRSAPVALAAATFRRIGHRLVDQVAEFLEGQRQAPVTRDETPARLRRALDLDAPLPEQGEEPAALVERTARQLFEHSLLNGHPRFFG